MVGRRRPNRGLVREPQEAEGVGRSLARGPEWPQCEGSLGTVLTKCPRKPDQLVGSRDPTMAAFAEGE